MIERINMLCKKDDLLLRNPYEMPLKHQKISSTLFFFEFIKNHLQ